jgi:two-component system, NarL family, response regulator NreC
MPSGHAELSQLSDPQKESALLSDTREEKSEFSEAVFGRRSPLRVLIADDHEIFIRGLKGILESSGLTIVAEASNGQEAVRLAAESKPDVAILDLGMPYMNGIEAAAEIRKLLPRTHVILLTVHSEDRYVLEALHAGVRGYVLKSRTASEVIFAIRDVQRGGIYLSPEVSRTIVDAYLDKGKPGPANLTPREMEVLRLVGEGKTTKEVASLLGVSVKTADTHRMNMMHKLDLHSSAELIHYAIRQGFVKP